MSKKVFVLNGPNLNMLGRREPGIYGADTLATIEADCRAAGERLGFGIEFRQTNHDSVLVDWLHEADDGAQAVCINPGAYGHTSIALHDAIRGARAEVVEVHLSNTHAREEFRHHSYISPVAKGVILGFGARSYELALQSLFPSQ